VSTLGTPRGPAEGHLERRLAAALLVIAAVWIVLLARLFYLQVVRGDEFRLSVERQSVRTHRVESTRGIVFDRHRAIVADSRPAFDVLVVPYQVQDLEKTLGRVAALAGLDGGQLLERFGRPRGSRRYHAMPVALDLGRDEIARVEARLWALSGVSTRVAPVRYYPFGDSMAHVLGKLGEITAAQLEQRDYLGYRQGDVIGQAGIEALYDRELRGRPGGRNVLVDAHGRDLEELGSVEPHPGHNLVLHLDQRMQAAAEAALDATPAGGALVAMDPRNGEVLALVSRPSFDANRFAAGIDRRAWEELRNDPRKPLQDRALSGQYPPGSTYKVVTAIAGLELGSIRPETEVHCGGSFGLGRRRYRCWKKEGHGAMNVHRALVQSCDVFFYQTALRVGVDRLAYYARMLGFAQPTGIELRPEAGGLIPTRAWKQQRFGEPWMEGETLSIGIGQGFNLVTPIQLAVAYAAIGNGGRVWRPQVLRGIEDVFGQPLEQRSPELVSELAVSPRTLEIVRAGLRGVVQEERGTGGAMRKLPGGIEAAGKTGTAQVVALAEDPPENDEDIAIEHRDHAWFVTYLPAESPELVVSVIVVHGGHGGSAAAPVARRVAETWLERKGQLHAGN
jgi:penicillin-binding protein 2